MSDQRKHIRTTVHRSCYVVHFDGRTEQGIVVDVNVVGAGIKLMEPKRLGERYQIAFRLPVGLKFEEILCNVVTIHCHLQKDVYQVGIKFENIPTSQEEIIAKFIATRKR